MSRDQRIGIGIGLALLAFPPAMVAVVALKAGQPAAQPTEPPPWCADDRWDELAYVFNVDTDCR